jgi:hypothetical protein
MTKIQNLKTKTLGASTPFLSSLRMFQTFEHLYFGFASNFGFRASNLIFLLCFLLFFLFSFFF